MNIHEISQVIRNSKNLAEMIAEFKSRNLDPDCYDWAMRSYLDFRAREKAVPLKGVFELTPRCNLNCSMCYVRMTPAEMAPIGRERTTEEWL